RGGRGAGHRIERRSDRRGLRLARAPPAGADRRPPAAAGASRVAGAVRGQTGLAHPQGGRVLDRAQGARGRAVYPAGGGAGRDRQVALTLNGTFILGTSYPRRRVPKSVSTDGQLEAIGNAKKLGSRLRA